MLQKSQGQPPFGCLKPYNTSWDESTTTNLKLVEFFPRIVCCLPSTAIDGDIFNSGLSVLVRSRCEESNEGNCPNSTCSCHYLPQTTTKYIPQVKMKNHVLVGDAFSNDCFPIFKVVFEGVLIDVILNTILESAQMAFMAAPDPVLSTQLFC